MDSNIKRLEKLTVSLPELDDMEEVFGPIVAISSKSKPGGRPSFGFGAYRDRDVGMMRLFISAGDQIDAHVHRNEHQWIIVISGKVRVRFIDSGREVSLDKYESVHINPNEPHVIMADDNTWCCTITMPPAAGYPPSAAPCKFVETELDLLKCAGLHGLATIPESVSLPVSS